MSAVDCPDYDGLATVEFGGYSFEVAHVANDHRTGVVVWGCDCGATMTDDEARQVHEILGRYLRDRENVDAQGDLFEGLLP